MSVIKTICQDVNLYHKKIEELQEIILTNIVLTGQIPAPTFEEAERVKFFLERMSSYPVDECVHDNYGNPIAVIRGIDSNKPPIFLVAHLDTFYSRMVEHHYTINEYTVNGAGILDNTTGVGVLLSLPEIIKHLDIRFQSDLVLIAPIQSIGEGNLRGIRRFLKQWGKPIRAALCLEGGELGRLSYYADGMMRVLADCKVNVKDGWNRPYVPNAILLLNELVNHILKIRIPQKPRTSIIINTVNGGTKYGNIPYRAHLGFEIHSDSDKITRQLYKNIQEIVDSMVHEYEIELNLRLISNIHAANLRYNHPLVKSAVSIMKSLDVKPIINPSESELSVFLARKIPALTLGCTHGKNYHLENAEIQIKPLFTGIAQILGILFAIDQGVCDNEKKE